MTFSRKNWRDRFASVFRQSRVDKQPVCCPIRQLSSSAWKTIPMVRQTSAPTYQRTKHRQHDSFGALLSLCWSAVVGPYKEVQYQSANDLSVNTIYTACWSKIGIIASCNVQLGCYSQHQKKMYLEIFFGLRKWEMCQMTCFY